MARTHPNNQNPPAVTPAATPPAKAAGANVPAPRAARPQALSPAAALRDMLIKHQDQIVAATPALMRKVLTADRVMRLALTAFNRNPDLAKCTAESIFACVVQATELGLELSNVLGHAYMVPRWNKHLGRSEAVFQVGWRGFVHMAFRTERILQFAPYIVHQGDQFDIEQGTSPNVFHRPALVDRGQVMGAYSVLVRKDGGKDVEWMTLAELLAHRDRYRSSKAGPWSTAAEEMMRKTPLRRLAKRADISIDITKAAVMDEYGEAGVEGETPSIEQATQDRAAALRARVAYLSSPDDSVPAIDYQPEQAGEPDAGDDAEYGPRAEDPVETREKLIDRVDSMLAAAAWTAERVADHIEQAFQVKDTTDLAKLTDEQLRTWAADLERARGQ